MIPAFSNMPSQLLPIQGTDLFPNTIEAPPIMRVAIDTGEEEVKDAQLDDQSGSSYGMEDGYSPKEPPVSAEKALKDEATYAAMKILEKAQPEIRGFYMAQKQRAAQSGLAIVQSSGKFEGGSMMFSYTMGVSMMDILVSSSAINALLKHLRDLYNDLLAVQFEAGDD